jgi:hypothetical protein
VRFISFSGKSVWGERWVSCTHAAAHILTDRLFSGEIHGNLRLTFICQCKGL